MQSTSAKRLASLTPDDISAVIQMAWEDRTTFETIEERTGLIQTDVIKLMRAEMKASSFKMWRTRMAGRKTKHRALRSTEMK
ncbi:MAG: TIGR03643 family protein, partial [Burkholderiaceae bacterium]|nr:TIGR03643 family protein [Burkholderiaceae bacterium]